MQTDSLRKPKVYQDSFIQSNLSLRNQSTMYTTMRGPRNNSDIFSPITGILNSGSAYHNSGQTPSRKVTYYGIPEQEELADLSDYQQQTPAAKTSYYTTIDPDENALYVDHMD